jgi:maltose O-acetyltransferase
MQGYEGKPITIGRNVWLGAHVIVLPGVTIGDNAVVGAGSVVTTSVSGGEIWAGVPARRIRSRFASSVEE